MALLRGTGGGGNSGYRSSLGSGWMGDFSPVATSTPRRASESQIRALSRAGGGFTGTGTMLGGAYGGVAYNPYQATYRPLARSTTNVGGLAGSIAGVLGGVNGAAGGGVGVAPAAAQAGGGGMAAAGGRQTGEAERLRQRFLQSLSRARGERARQAMEGRALRSQAFSDYDRLVNTPAISDQALRNIQGQAIRAHRGREATINRQTEEALARAGLSTGGRGVELARRTRAEMGPGLAQAVSQSQTQAELANAQALRSGLGARAGYAGSLPVVGEDYTSELGVLGEAANVAAQQEASARDFQAIQDILRQNDLRREDTITTRLANDIQGQRRVGAEMIGQLAISNQITDQQAMEAYDLVKSRGMNPEEALNRVAPGWDAGQKGKFRALNRGNIRTIAPGLGI